MQANPICCSFVYNHNLFPLKLEYCPRSRARTFSPGDTRTRRVAGREDRYSMCSNAINGHSLPRFSGKAEKTQICNVYHISCKLKHRSRNLRCKASRIVVKITAHRQQTRQRFLRCKSLSRLLNGPLPSSRPVPMHRQPRGD